MRKKYIPAVLLALTACTAQEPQLEPSPTGFSLTVGMSEAASRTALGDLVAGRRSVYWADGDCISANGVPSAALLDVGEKVSTASFSFASDPGAPYKIVYPSSIWQADGKVMLPTVLEAASGGFGGPMYGYSADGGAATLHHLVAYARVNVVKGAEGQTLRYVRLTGGGGEQLSGSFGIDYTTGALVSSSASAAAAKVFAPVDALLGDETTSILLPVPAGEYPSGFTVRLVDSEGHFMDKSRGASTFEAGHIYDLASFAFVPTGTLVTIDLPEVEQEEEPASAALALTTVDINQMSYTLDGGVYTLTTSGTDPYVFTTALQDGLSGTETMLSFEYKGDGISDLQLYFPPLAESRSQHGGGFSSADGWTSFAVDLSASIASFGWGRAGDILRLDFGTESGKTLQVRNLCIREQTAGEKAPAQIAAAISTYLSTTYPASVTSVSVGSSSITVKGTAPAEEGYFLAEITPWQEVATLTAFPYRTELSGRSFSVNLSRNISRSGVAYDRLLSKWAVVDASGNLCSHARFADEVAALSSPAPVPLSSKKGLGGYAGLELQTSDLDALGISSVTVNILLNGVINTEKSGGFTTAYTYGGSTYYIDGSYVAGLDATLRNCASRGIVASGILLVANSATSAATSIMKHPECTGGLYSMPNMTTPEAVNLYAAVLSYLGSRYNGGSYGRIHHWIMHNEVDASLTWTNMGVQPQMRYVNEYVKSLRMASLLLRQWDASAAVLTSLTHAWAVAENQYAPKHILSDINALCAAEGDFWWGVGYHCYPQILFQPAFWSGDTESTYSQQSGYVTFRNLEVLNDWALSPENQYKGSVKRIVFLSENGTNAMSYSDDHLSQQAAGVCWAWKKIQALEGIDAMQWHAWRDNPEEGLNLGLRKNTDNGSAVKPAWEAYKAAGTSSEDSVFAPYLSVIGISSWDQIML